MVQPRVAGAYSLFKATLKFRFYNFATSQLILRARAAGWGVMKVASYMVLNSLFLLMIFEV